MNNHHICNSMCEGQMKVINLATIGQSMQSIDKCNTQKLQHLIVCSNGQHGQGNNNLQSKDNNLAAIMKENPSRFINTNLTRYIVMHSFVNLQSILINQTEINSIEFTAFLDAPKLKDLFLINNHITNISSLNRLTIPELKIMNIEGNHTQQMNLSRMDLSQNPQSLLLEDRYQDQIKLQDISQLVKLKPQFLQSIQLCGSNRIKQQKVRQILRERFYQKTLHDNTSVRYIQIIDEWSYNPW